MNLRVSATDIDAYRRYRADEDMTLDEFVAQMRREFEPTPAMAAGTALHKALELAEPGDFATLKANGHTFTVETIARLDLPDIREAKATKDYQVGPITVTLVGKVDAAVGNRIDDHKLTSRFDAERFLNSYQWRLYLEIFSADIFRWNVFEGRETEPCNWTIFAFHPLVTYRYPKMGEDVEREVGLFAEFASKHLPERIAA